VINIEKEQQTLLSYEYFQKQVDKWSKLKIGEIQVDGKYPTMNINNCNILFTDDAYSVEFELIKNKE
jgi:hypothetical protein